MICQFPCLRDSLWTTVSGLLLSVFVAGLMIPSGFAEEAVSGAPVLTPWKIHAMAILDSAKGSTPESLAQAETQYNLASKLRADPLLDFAMAYVRYQHGHDADAKRLNQHAWNRQPPNLTDVAHLHARILLNLKQTSNLLDFCDEVISRCIDPAVPPDTQTELAELAGRLIRLLQDPPFGQAADRPRILELEKSANSAPQARLVSAYMAGRTAVDKQLTVDNADRNRRETRTEKERERKRKRIQADAEEAAQKKENIAALQKLSAEELETRINRNTVAMTQVRTLWERNYPEWQRRDQELEYLQVTYAQCLELGVPRVRIEGKSYTQLALAQLVRNKAASHQKFSAHVAAIFANGNRLAFERQALYKQHHHRTGQLLQADKTLTAWQQKFQLQDKNLKSAMESAREKTLGTAEKQQQAIPIDVEAQLERLKTLIVAAPE